MGQTSRASSRWRFDAERSNAVVDARTPRCEIVDLSTREVWQTREPVPRAWYDALQLERPLVKVGYGAGNMDRSWFRRSPDGDADGPVRERDIGGRRFFFCARAPSEMGEGSPRRMQVDKHHSIAYAAEREVEVLTNDEGLHYVLVMTGAESAPAPGLPEGWTLQRLRLAQEWKIDLPAPTDTWWFAGMRSYQGPVRLPESGAAEG